MFPSPVAVPVPVPTPGKEIGLVILTRVTDTFKIN